MKKSPIQRILIIQTASIGDVVLATPLIGKLSDFYPQGEIDFLVKQGIQQVLTDHPLLHQVLVWDKSFDKYKHLYRLLQFIRSRRYDVVVNVQRFAASGFLTAFSGATIRLGFRKNPFSLFYSRRLPHHISADPAKSRHETHRNLSLISSITDNDMHYRTELYPSQVDFAKVSQYKTQKYICVAPASLWFTKQYPEQKWIEFLRALPEQIAVYMLGAPNDEPLCRHIIDESGYPQSLNLAGKLTILQTAALMKDAAMNFVNDSAPLHFASAMNAPVTAIFCSTVPAFGFGPLSDDSAIVETDIALSCRPCGLHGFRQCPEGHFKCALTIPVEKLLQRIP
jgi:heptosyltransferase-2